MNDDSPEGREVRERAENLQAFADKSTADLIAKLKAKDLQWLASDPQRYAPCRERANEVQTRLSRMIEEKEEIIRLLLACTVAQVPMVLLGPPGTAKSLAVRAFCALLGLRPHHENISRFEGELRRILADPKELRRIKDDPLKPSTLKAGQRPLFEYLVTRFTTPEEILGAANIDAMLELSLYYRESEGMLPSAQVAFLDEIFKANSAILNSLLSIINERIYYNAGRAFDVELMMVFGASNEAPDLEELGALYDRFPIRAVSNAVRDASADKMIQKSVEGAYDAAMRAPGNGQQEGQGQFSPEMVASMNDFRLLGRINFVTYGGRDQFQSAARVRDGFCFPYEFLQMFKQLRSEFGISDRTPERLARVARARALLDGKDHLEPDHLKVFKYCAPDVDSASILGDVVEEMIASIPK